MFLTNEGNNRKVFGRCVVYGHMHTVTEDGTVQNKEQGQIHIIY